jgi:hypothetical protein
MSVTSIREAAEQVDAVLDREDRDEELGRLSAHERLSCPVHRRWVHQGGFISASARHCTSSR